jgi:hypothetical protein
VFGVALIGIVATSSLGAMTNPSRTTYFTFRNTVLLPGVALPAGTYIFEIANPNSDANVVRVLSLDRSKLYAMRLTQMVYRPQTSNMKATILLGEAPAGSPRAVTSWFPDRESTGRAFIY